MGELKKYEFIIFRHEDENTDKLLGKVVFYSTSRLDAYLKAEEYADSMDADYQRCF